MNQQINVGDVIIDTVNDTVPGGNTVTALSRNIVNGINMITITTAASTFTIEESIITLSQKGIADVAAWVIGQ